MRELLESHRTRLPLKVILAEGSLCTTQYLRLEWVSHAAQYSASPIMVAILRRVAFCDLRLILALYSSVCGFFRGARIWRKPTVHYSTSRTSHFSYLQTLPTKLFIFENEKWNNMANGRISIYRMHILNPDIHPLRNIRTPPRILVHPLFLRILLGYPRNFIDTWNPYPMVSKPG